MLNHICIDSKLFNMLLIILCIDKIYFSYAAQESTCTARLIQRRTEWKCCGQMRPKSSSLASTQLTVFGGRGKLPMTPRTPSTPSNMEVETLCFGGVFLLRGQDNCIASKGRWTGPCTVRARELKMGRGGYSSMTMTQNTRPRQQRSDSRRSTLRSWSVLASLQTFIP